MDGWVPVDNCMIPSAKDFFQSRREYWTVKGGRRLRMIGESVVLIRKSL